MPGSGETPEVQLRLGWDNETPFPPPIYTNYIQGGLTPEDFTLNLGWYAVSPTARPEDGVLDVAVQPVARIVIPLNLLRSTIALMQRQLEGYKKTASGLSRSIRTSPSGSKRPRRSRVASSSPQLARIKFRSPEG